MGRPCKLTLELQEEICQYIAGGNTFERSCILAGIHHDTLLRWRNKGRTAKSGKFFGFFGAVKRAEEQFKAHNIAIIQQAAIKQWQAAAWLLERKYPEEFGRREKIEISNKLDELVEEFRKIA